MIAASFRIRGKRWIMGALVLVVLLTGIFAILRSVGAQAAPEQKQKATKKSYAAGTNEERIHFLTGYGWEVEEEPVEIIEVIVPEEFDQVYQDYNAIQKKQGLDLEKYSGRRCKRYTYSVTNYPDANFTVRANLLVYEGKIIGGDVCAIEESGFMHGFAMENREAG